MLRVQRANTMVTAALDSLLYCRHIDLLLVVCDRGATGNRVDSRRSDTGQLCQLPLNAMGSERRKKISHMQIDSLHPFAPLAEGHTLFS